MEIIQRHITGHLLDALADRPIILLNGARQTGKSTLVQGICTERHFPYFTLDDFTLLSAVKNDPTGFLAGVPGPLAIDEVQRVQELFLAMKAEVDRRRTPGRFLLTGSANVLLLPQMAEMLVGRMEILSLWPLSQGELQGKQASFLNVVFDNEFLHWSIDEFDRSAFLDTLLLGGYPEVHRLRSEQRRSAWFNAYITTLLQRDVQELARIEGLSEMPRLFTMLAAQSGSLVNMSELARNLGISHMTMKRYLALLQTIFLLQFLPAWSGNVSKRLIKAPKVLLNDTGLLAFLLGLNAESLLFQPAKMGILVETFVAQELQKQISWHPAPIKLFYYRTTTGREVDFVLEAMDGRIIGIEVKSAATVQAHDFKGLSDLADTVGDRFQRGIVLYLGTKTIPFAANLFAVPIHALWM